MAHKVRLQAEKLQLRAFTAASHFSQSNEAVIGLDFNNCADKAPPVLAIAVAERSLQGDSNRGGPNIYNLHLDHPFTVPLHISTKYSGYSAISTSFSTMIMRRWSLMIFFAAASLPSVKACKISLCCKRICSQRESWDKRSTLTL